MSKLLNFKTIEHFLVVIIVAFLSQVAIAGAPLDFTSSTGRAAAVTAIAAALWHAFRGAADTTGTTPTGS